MKWCKIEKIYVCDRCWERNCARGHGIWINNTGSSKRWKGTLIILFIAVLIPTGMVAIYDYYLPQEWNALPVSKILDVAPGATIKVHGILNASDNPDRIALKENLQNGKYGFYTEWDDNAHFYIQDDSGKSEVSTEDYFLIKDPPTTMQGAFFTNIRIYTDRQEATIVGDVVYEPGKKVLHLRAMVPEHDEIPSDPTYQSAGAMMIGLSTFMILA